MTDAFGLEEAEKINMRDSLIVAMKGVTADDVCF